MHTYYAVIIVRPWLRGAVTKIQLNYATPEVLAQVNRQQYFTPKSLVTVSHYFRSRNLGTLCPLTEHTIIPLFLMILFY